jgi:hypothetical protein
MEKTAKRVVFDNKIIEALENDGKEYGRDFTAEVNYACRKYLESIK